MACKYPRKNGHTHVKIKLVSAVISTFHLDKSERPHFSTSLEIKDGKGNHNFKWPYFNDFQVGALYCITIIQPDS